MKTNLEAIDDVYQVVKSSQLMEEVTGSLYKMQRPDNSIVEDVVINALPMSDGNPGTCVVNINIYVKDLAGEINGKRQTMPDYARMKALALVAAEDFEEYYSGSFTFYIASQSVQREQEINQHYINFRLEYKAFTL